MAFRLFAHEFWRYFPDDKKAYEFKGCPEYVKKMLHMNCHNVKDITFIWKEKRLLDAYLKDDCGCINFHIVTTLFPNVQRIRYYCMQKDMSYWKTSQMFTKILVFLTQNEQNIRTGSVTLNKITIFADPQLTSEMQQFVQPYMQGFIKCGWMFQVMPRYAGRGSHIEHDEAMKRRAMGYLSPNGNGSKQLIIGISNIKTVWSETAHVLNFFSSTN
eukprot:506103_1